MNQLTSFVEEKGGKLLVKFNLHETFVEEKEYKAEVIAFGCNDNVLRLKCKSRLNPYIPLYYEIDISNHLMGSFFRFCVEMDIVNANGEAEIDELLSKLVVVTVKDSDNGTMKIETIRLLTEVEEDALSEVSKEEIEDFNQFFDEYLFTTFWEC